MRRDDRCAEFCGNKIHGIVENLKLRGKISAEFDLEVKPVRGFAWIGKDDIEMRCPLHQRRFVVRRR